MDEVIHIPRLDVIERRLFELTNVVAKLFPLSGVLPTITVGAGTVGITRTDTIAKKRKKDKCTVTVSVTVTYDFESSRTEQDAAGKVTKSCTTYKITTTVTISEVCNPTSDAHADRTTSHVSHKEFCNGAGDTPTTGETIGFDGKGTDTLTYPHGTKVQVEQDGDKVNVKVTFPDGTTSTVDY